MPVKEAQWSALRRTSTRKQQPRVAAASKILNLAMPSVISWFLRSSKIRSSPHKKTIFRYRHLKMETNKLPLKQCRTIIFNENLRFAIKNASLKNYIKSHFKIYNTKWCNKKRAKIWFICTINYLKNRTFRGNLRFTSKKT